MPEIGDGWQSMAVLRQGGLTNERSENWGRARRSAPSIRRRRRRRRRRYHSSALEFDVCALMSALSLGQGSFVMDLL